MASPIVYTGLSSFLSEPSAIVLQPSPVALAAPNGMTESTPACVAGPDLCPDGVASPVYVGLGIGEKGSGPQQQPPLAPMPFATPTSIMPTTTMASEEGASPTNSPPMLLPTTTLTSIITEYTPMSTFPPTPTSTMDAIMHGNPDPFTTHLHTSTIIGISVNSVLAFSMIPLLIFMLVMKYRLHKAKAFQLGQGPRRPVEWGFEGWEESRREYVVDDAFMRGFRRRVGERAFMGREWI